MGAADKIMDVLAFTFDGMPLLYSGQEEPLKKRLEFFEKDSIPWKNYAYADFFKTLFDLKQRNKALGNGSAGVPLEKIAVHKDVYAFEKNKDGDRVIVMLNLSAKPQTAMITKDIPAMQDIFTLQAASYKKDQKITLKPWEYRVYSTR